MTITLARSPQRALVRRSGLVCLEPRPGRSIPRDRPQWPAAVVGPVSAWPLWHVGPHGGSSPTRRRRRRLTHSPGDRGSTR